MGNLMRNGKVDPDDPFAGWTDAYLVKRIDSIRLDIAIEHVLAADCPKLWAFLPEQERRRRVRNGRRSYFREKRFREKRDASRHV